MLAEIRIEALGAISAATAEFDRGLTVLTGETGTGKTMVVTGLHLLGGARADATRVRSGSERAVVEGRFTTIELGDGVSSRVDEILESSGAERDDDGSVIAARSVSRDGPSRAYLGGRSVPAKSLSGFTTELLALHGQNDQLRLMRPDEQRGALDRFVDVGALMTRYRTLRDEWLTAQARPGRPQAAVPRTGAGGRSTALRARRDRRRRTATRRGRNAGGRHPAAVGAGRATRSRSVAPGWRCPASWTTRGRRSTSAADGVGRARSALAATDDSALRALAERLGEAQALIGDVSTELGGYLAELPS